MSEDYERAYREAWAAAWDAGNRNMQEHGREAWGEDDFDAACAELDRLWPYPSGGLLAPQEPT